MPIIMIPKEYEDELMHYGVKGMKWGVRRYTNADGSLNDRGIKKYAQKGYAQDSYRSNKTRLGKAYDLYTGAHKNSASIQYDLSSKKQNKARAEKYLAEKQKSKNQKVKNQKVKKKSNVDRKITAQKVNKVVNKILLASLTDDIFYGGKGKAAIKQGYGFVKTKIDGKMAVREAERIIRRNL